MGKELGDRKSNFSGIPKDHCKEDFENRSFELEQGDVTRAIVLLLLQALVFLKGLYVYNFIWV